jgi:hypothetical protein
MTEYDPEVEEIDLADIELHEDPPEADVPRFVEDGLQDDIEEGEALGDDLAKGEKKEESDA